MGSVKITLATEPEGHFQALYLDGRLIGNLGDIASRNYLEFEPLSDILNNLFSQPEFDGFEFQEEYRYQVGFKTWTDYGWEWDAEWPALLSETGEVPKERYTWTDEANLP
jgi:hypothetical protein